MKDLAPDLILADISLPSRSGYEICEYVKTSGKYPQTRVLLTAGPVAAFDDTRAQAAGADGFVRKPFEASVLLAMVQPLIEKPDRQRDSGAHDGVQACRSGSPLHSRGAGAPQPAPPRPIDREQVRAAVILALEASLITMIENITDKVVVALEADSPATMPRQRPPKQPKPGVAAASVAAPVARRRGREQPKSQPAPAPEEPVVRIRTPVFPHALITHARQ